MRKEARREGAARGHGQGDARARCRLLRRQGTARAQDRFSRPRFRRRLDYDKIRELAIVVDLDETCTFRVMHPLHNLESRTHNVAGLPDQYNNPLGLAQLRASIVCARAFLRTLLDNEEPSGIRHVLNLNTRIFKFAAYDTHALAVYRDHGIDVFDALFLDERLPEKFRDDGYPRWVQRLEKQRG
jgi:hypothetical protein